MTISPLDPYGEDNISPWPRMERMNHSFSPPSSWCVQTITATALRPLLCGSPAPSSRPDHWLTFSASNRRLYKEIRTHGSYESHKALLGPDDPFIYWPLLNRKPFESQWYIFHTFALIWESLNDNDAMIYSYYWCVCMGFIFWQYRLFPPLYNVQGPASVRC